MTKCESHLQPNIWYIFDGKFSKLSNFISMTIVKKKSDKKYIKVKKPTHSLQCSQKRNLCVCPMCKQTAKIGIYISHPWIIIICYNVIYIIMLNLYFLPKCFACRNLYFKKIINKKNMYELFIIIGSTKLYI